MLSHLKKIFLTCALLFLFNSNALAEKKLIVLIADGLGPGQLGFFKTAWDYARDKKIVPDRESSYDTLLKRGEISLVSVKPNGFLVADSACAASSISTGSQCLPGTLGLNENGEAIEIFSEFANKNDIAIGLVSDTRITHATPAAFFARSISRSKEEDIAKQLVISNVKVALSGGARFFNAELKKGIPFVYDSVAMNERNGFPLFGLFGEERMPNAYEEKLDAKIPTLLEMTKKAYDLLSKEKSFFLMLESGQIDWASHDNDIGLLWKELLRFDEVLEYLLALVHKDPDVSLMVLSDHETGGLHITYERFETKDSAKKIKYFPDYAPRYDYIEDNRLDIIFKQQNSLRDIAKDLKREGNSEKEIKTILEEKLFNPVPKNILSSIQKIFTDDYTVILRDEFPNNHLCYVDKDATIQVVLAKEISRKTGVRWSTGSHTVPLIPFVMIDQDGFRKYQKPLDLKDVGQLIRAFFSTDPS